jgi:hypothetical protein
MIKHILTLSFLVIIFNGNNFVLQVSELDAAVVLRCQSADARKMTNSLLVAIFGQCHLASHSLTGQASNKQMKPKPALDAIKVAQIISE